MKIWQIIFVIFFVNFVNSGLEISLEDSDGKRWFFLDDILRSRVYFGSQEFERIKCSPFPERDAIKWDIKHIYFSGGRFKSFLVRKRIYAYIDKYPEKELWWDYYQLSIYITGLRSDFILHMTCSQITNPANFNSVFAFMNVDPLKHLYIRDNTNIYDSSIIPCISTDPIRVVKLFKSSQNESVEISNAIYSPIIGFVLKDDVFDGNYYCKSDTDSVFWATSIYDLKVVPNIENITVFIDHRGLNLICQIGDKNDSIHFEWSPKENLTSLALKYSPNYVSILVKFYGEQRISEISCKSESGLVHIWKIKVLDKPKLLNKFEFQSGKYACYFEGFKDNALNPYISGKILHYSKLEEARFAIDTEFSKSFSESELLIQNGSNLRSKEQLCRQRGQIVLWNCFAFEDFIVESGLAQCSLDGLIDSYEFFTGLTSRLTFLDWRQADLNDLIKITDVSDIYYANGTLDYKPIFCSAVFYLFSLFTEFVLVYKNGTSFKFEGQTFNASFEGYIEPKLLSVDVVMLICNAPWRNSSEWISTNTTLDIRYASKPRIKTSETEPRYTFISGSTENFLRCEVEELESAPDVNFKWIFNEKELNWTRMETDNSSILEFPAIFYDFQGQYICQAYNELGYTDEAFFNVFVPGKGNLGQILGISISAMALLFMLIIAALWRKNRHYKQNIRDLSNGEVEAFFNGDENKKIDGSSEVCVDRAYDENFEIDLENLRINETAILGSGAFGTVFRGEYLGHDVAVKTTKPNADIEYFKALLTELKIMSQMGEHPNIVCFIGASTKNIQQRKLYMIVEICPLGNLQNFLRENGKAFECRFKHGKRHSYANIEYKINTVDLLLWSYQIANGMEYIASKKVVHADLATRNVLLFDKTLVKITDFGLSRNLYNYSVYQKKNNQKLPWPWLAIESLKYFTFSTESDVWSYGVTLWEIFNLSQSPFVGHIFSNEFIQLLESGFRLNMPKNANQKIYNDAICRCWSNDPDDRPKFSELKNIFAEIMKCLNPELESMEAAYTQL